MARLGLKDITVSYETNEKRTTALHNINLNIEDGDFVSLIGPSGCGKSTLLDLVAGLRTPSSGQVLIDGHEICGPGPDRGMVFQAYALFPNMNVADNIGFGLKIARMPKQQREARVEEMLKLIGLSGYGKRFPFELSGGQQQRVALARALAPSPRMLLLDEPLSALDAKIRVSLREQIREIQRELGITTVFVTHDQEEALSISDRIVVLNAGSVEQFGTPFEIYNRPQTKFVATFVGQINTLDATVADAERKSVRIGSSTVTIPALPGTARNGETIALTMRPEAVSLSDVTGRDIQLEGKVSEVAFLGSVIRLKVDLGGSAISLDTFNDQHTPPPVHGTPVRLGIASSDVLVLGN